MGRGASDIQWVIDRDVAKCPTYNVQDSHPHRDFQSKMSNGAEVEKVCSKGGRAPGTAQGGWSG